MINWVDTDTFTDENLTKVIAIRLDGVMKCIVAKTVLLKAIDTTTA
jgi:hypothetical protein